MNRRPFEAVIFDMDGLLLDTERVALATYLEAAADLDLHASEELFLTFIGKSWRTTRMRMEEALGVEDGRRMVDAWTRCFETRLRSGGVPKKPGAEQLLEMLAGTGTPIALATSTESRKTTLTLESVELLHYFPVRATGDEVANGKPAPDIFLLAAERLGIAPGECVVLEDSEPGVAGAAAAGMRVVMVPDLRPPSREAASMAERVCRSLVEAGSYLQAALRT